MGIICFPFLILPTIYLRNPVNVWIIGILKLLKLTCNITYEIKGVDKIPKKGLVGDIAFIHPKSMGGVLMELVDSDSIRRG